MPPDLGIFTTAGVHYRHNQARRKGLERAKVRPRLEDLQFKVRLAEFEAWAARKALIHAAQDGAFVPRLALLLQELLEAEAELYELQTMLDNVEPDVIGEGCLGERPMPLEEHFHLSIRRNGTLRLRERFGEEL